MPVKELRQFLEQLEEAGEVVRIRREVDSRFEVSAILRRLDKEGGKAAIFESIKGYGGAKLVGNVLTSRGRVSRALGVKEEELMSTLIDRRRSRVEPVIVSWGPVKEAVAPHVDVLARLPVPTYHEGDSNPYIAGGVLFSKDPDTGVREAGIHRVEVKAPGKLGVLLMTGVLAELFRKLERRGQPMGIAISIGPDPITMLGSVMLTSNKVCVIGGLRGEPLEMVKCEAVDVEVPAYSEAVVEGEVLPGVREDEGPFGESTGYYLKYKSPVVKVKAITSRSELIYQAVLPWSSEDYTLLSLAYKADIMEGLRALAPFVVDVNFIPNGLTLNAVVSIEKRSEGDAKQAILSLLAVNPYVKHVIVVDSDVDIYDVREVSWALATRFQAGRGLYVMRDLPGLGIDPTAREVDGGWLTDKLGIDATIPIDARDRMRKIDVPRHVKEEVERRWEEYLRA